jgi:phosphomevalonate kinase
MEPCRLIGLSGKQFAGKDHVADWLCAHLPGFAKRPLAGAIKTAYCQQHGLTLGQLEVNKASHRPGLIAMGDWGRAQDPDYWIGQVLAQPGCWIVPDVRLPREHAMLRAQDAFLIRVEATRSVRAQRGRLVSEDDPTETALDDVTDWDAVVTNNGTVQDLDAALALVLLQIQPWAARH